MLKPTAMIMFTGLILAAGQAMAGCGTGAMATAGAKPMIYLGDGGGGLLRTDYFPGGQLLRVSSFGPFRTSAITGLWKFTFTSDGKHPGPPQGAPVDAGFVTWHDDGTEIMNSGRAPVSGSFCMGVWKQVGSRTYLLNHWALSWIPGYIPGGATSGGTSSWDQVGGPNSAFTPAGPTNIQETVTLSRDGNEYTGTFTLTNYVYDGVSVTDANTNMGQPMVISGTVAATRIEP
jgi:hypothetical protein